MIPNEDEDEFTELVDGLFPRVDLVGKAANGVPRFLIAKSTAAQGQRGVIEANVVRELVAKATQSQQAVFTSDGVLIGIVDPVDVQPVATGDEQPTAPPKAQPQQQGGPIPEGDLEPAPPGTQGIDVAKSEVDILAVAHRAHRYAERADLTPVGMMLEKRRATERAAMQLQRLRAEQRAGVLKARESSAADKDSPTSRRRHGLG